MPRPLLVVLVGAIMAVGLAGTIIPVLPGLVLVWGGAVVYGLIAGFGVAGWVAMAVITVLGVLGLVASVRIPQQKVAEHGLALRGRLLAIALAVVGFFLIPVVGGPLGFVGGVWLAQWWRSRNEGAAWAATKVALSGLWRGAVAQFVAGLGMTSAWLLWVVVG